MGRKRQPSLGRQMGEEESKRREDTNPVIPTGVRVFSLHS